MEYILNDLNKFTFIFQEFCMSTVHFCRLEPRSFSYIMTYIYFWNIIKKYILLNFKGDDLHDVSTTVC